MYNRLLIYGCVLCAHDECPCMYNVTNHHRKTINFGINIYTNIFGKQTHGDLIVLKSKVHDRFFNLFGCITYVPILSQNALPKLGFRCHLDPYTFGMFNVSVRILNVFLTLQTICALWQ
jgi:hypothetical protein